MNDFSRQSNIFKPDDFHTPVHVVGAGATGSWLTMLLAKLGIEDITVYDFDTVGEHNIPNQIFEETDGDDGVLKVDALFRIIRKFTGITISPKNMIVDKTTKLKGIVFLLTDTMASRKEIWTNCLKYNPNIDMVVETRMGLRDGRIYCINPMNPEHVKAYEATLYDDGEAEVSACGTSQSIAPTATLVASMAVWGLLNWHNGNRDIINNEIIMDIQHGYQVANKYGQGWN